MWIRQFAEALPYPERHFDVVTSVSALHFFADPRKAASEMRRVIRPGIRVFNPFRELD